MCGILGFIGKSKNPRVTFELANALLIKTEVRGDHATGFWACERGNGRLFFDKEPTKSSIYANREIWAKQFSAVETDLLIAHCRYTSMNVGHEKYNKNNHPHVSADKRVALVHNGRVPEYTDLKGRYDLKSDCDSEILLGMFEGSSEHKDKTEALEQEFPNFPPEISYRMLGVKEVFSRVNFGAMAVAIGERGENTTSRHLWLFRDEDRPLHIIDLRDTLGQIFFCSTPEIWKATIESDNSFKQYMPENQKLIEFPTFHVWFIGFNQTEDPNNDAWMIRKYKITKAQFYNWEEEKDKIKVPRVKTAQPITTIISRLDDNEEVGGKIENADLPAKTHTVNVPADRKKKVIQSNVDTTSSIDDEGDVDARQSRTAIDPALEDLTEITLTKRGIDMKEFDKNITELKGIAEAIDTQIRNRVQSGSIDEKEFEIVNTSVHDAVAELKAFSFLCGKRMNQYNVEMASLNELIEKMIEFRKRFETDLTLHNSYLKVLNNGMKRATSMIELARDSIMDVNVLKNEKLMSGINVLVIF